ncbi:thiamine phosphate synthase [Candidatus Pelagibacter communis]|uniref:thiamine phosphate synthase n=1 Tax=Pelagibacter ubique TaxID=198252 RepID=UPI0009E27E0C|nr:thiamine phosphate synthase [Candidatus Pelagibacter ubique]
MRINKKKFIYLISPNKVYKNFYRDLKEVLKTKKISFFQMRFKNYSLKKKIEIGKKIKKICKQTNVKFLVNDSPWLAKEINADGCHLGQKDKSVKEARELINNKIIGITCHNSLKFARNAINDGADYIAFGAFFPSKTKKVKYKANLQLLKKLKISANIHVVAIGGINNLNYKKLLLNKADFLAISGYIWNNKKLKPVDTIEYLK